MKPYRVLASWWGFELALVHPSVWGREGPCVLEWWYATHEATGRPVEFVKARAGPVCVFLWRDSP